MQVATRDVGRLPRIIAGCAGGAVAAFGASSAFGPIIGVRTADPSTTASLTGAAVGTAGVALLVLATAGTRATRWATGRVLAGVAALIGVTVLADEAVTALATLLVGAALAFVGIRLRAGPAPLPVSDPLLAVAALIAVIAPLSPLLDGDAAPDGVMSPAVGLALLALAGGTVLIGAGREGSPQPHPDAEAAPGVPPPPVSEANDATQLDPPIEGGATGDRPLLADALLQSMDEAVMLLDVNHRVLDVNRRWRELTGLSTDEAVGRRPPYPWAPDSGNEAPESGSGERLLQRVDGTGVPVLATVAAVPDARGLPRAYVATYVDIAEHKRVAAALAERAEELQRSNGSLRESNERLESALAFKNDLMTMLSHDMAQPVSSIASLAELLVSDWSGLDEDIRLELATKIDRNSGRLTRMLNDLQLLFRLDTGSVTARRTPVPLREVVDAVRSELDAGHIQIAVDDDVSVLADRGHLWHVLHNLMANALKYGAAPIEVRADRVADRVLIVVQDHGPGIPADLVPGLFDRFARGGVGLFIVGHLVEANGGSVRHERHEPQGARLIVELEPGTMTAPSAHR